MNIYTITIVRIVNPSLLHSCCRGINTTLNMIASSVYGFWCKVQTVTQESLVLGEATGMMVMKKMETNVLKYLP